MTHQTTHLKQDEQVTICGRWWNQENLELVELLEDATCKACTDLASPHMRTHPEHDEEREALRKKLAVTKTFNYDVYYGQADTPEHNIRTVKS